MTDSEQYVADRIRLWVWSGFYSPSQVEEMIDDIVDEECNIQLVRSLIGPEFRQKQADEHSWPAVTDCERVDKVFYSLHEEGICALSNAGYTMSDAYSDVSEAVAQAPAGHYQGFCFYHGQDVDRAIDSQGLMFAFGDLADDAEASLQVGHKVAKALRSAGFEIDWDGTIETRINVPKFDWKRRTQNSISATQ